MSQPSLTVELPEQPLGTRILRGALAGFAINLAGNGFLFIGQLLIARQLSRTEYAEFTVCISLMAILAMFADLGMNPLITRMLAQAEEDASRGMEDRRGSLLGTAVALRLVLSIFVALIIITIGRLFYPVSMVQNCLILLITLLISSRVLAVRPAAESMFRSQGKYYLVALFALFDAVAFAVLLFLGRYYTLRLQSVLWVYALCNVPGFILLVIALVRWIRRENVSLRLDPVLAKGFLLGSIPLCIGTIFLTIHIQIDSLLLDKLSTPFEVASYGATMRLNAAAAPIPLVLAAVIAPELTRLLRQNDQTRSLQLTDISLRILLVLGFFIALLITTCSGLIVPLTLGEKYASASPLLIWTGWMLLPIFIGTLLMEVSVAAGQSWFMTANAGVCMVAVIIGDLFLLRKFGATGAMVSKLIAVSLGAGLLVWLSRNSGHLDTRRFTSAFLRTGLATIASLAASWLFMAGNFHLAIVVIVQMGIYSLVIHATNVLTAQEVLSLWRRVTKRPSAIIG
ncbi:MAG: oligosaccharide flippase family protein [Bacteroidota bacterium]|nr:oligosaccharide flippase family protein [Bacteroidota bacterium]MDP4233037.1 oligosaccharide flippase family protein [Bacteroidota bacterium]MDP4241818.1 oligosaccharide flippase family protein [Bacteroidota bacterium]MDP4288761.1 oligosaccharide flippase family protein [Bacteroidota bacterium]